MHLGHTPADPEDWAKLGLLLLYDGEWNGRQIVPRSYLKEMLRPSPTEPVYALGIWLANNEHQAKEEEQPFEAPGIFYLDGHSKQRAYIVPGKDLVIVRVGENGRGWDEAALPNAVLHRAEGPGFCRTVASGKVWRRPRSLRSAKGTTQKRPFAERRRLLRSTRVFANNFGGAAIAGTDPLGLTQPAIDLRESLAKSILWWQASRAAARSAPCQSRSSAASSA